MDTNFKYLTEDILTDGHCLSPCICKYCNGFKNFDRLNFDGLARKRQKCEIFPIKNHTYLFFITEMLHLVTYLQLFETTVKVK